MPLCFACYSEAERLVVPPEEGESTSLQAARAEIEALNLKITSCNLNAMKQIEALHHGGAVELQDELHQFYEPLRYMNADTRDLVLLTMVQKLRQLDMDTAPNSLVQQLIAMIRSLGGSGDVNVDRSKQDEEEESDGKKEKDSADKKARAEAERKAALLAKQLEAAEARLKELLDQATQTEAELQKVRKELRDQEMQTEIYRQEAQKAKEQLAENEQKHAQLDLELRTARKQLQEQASNISQLESQLQAALQDAERKAREGREAARRSEELQAKIDALERELAKYKQRRSKHAEVQTDLGGEELQKMIDENTRLKVALEEMKAKLNDLLEECNKKGLGKAVEKSMSKVGLGMEFRCRDIFKRLYDDAVDRIDRMDKLRERYQQEKERHLAPDNVLPEEMLVSEARKRLSMAEVEAVVQSPEHRIHVREFLENADKAAGLSTWQGQAMHLCKDQAQAQGTGLSRGSIGPPEWQHRVLAHAASGRQSHKRQSDEADADLQLLEKEENAKKRGSIAGWPGGRVREYSKLGNTQSLPSLHTQSAAMRAAAAGPSKWGQGRRARADL